MRTLITGISGGLGQALKKSLEKKGFKIFGHSNTKDSDIKADFKNLKSLAPIERFIRDNDISCLINNAGIYSSKPLTEIEDEEIEGIINVNLVAPMLLSKYLYSFLMKNNRDGLIVNINSLSGRYPNYNEAVYSASKHGLAGLGSSLSINQKKTKVKVIDCFPGGLKTKMTITRPDHESLINPEELAESIANIISNDKTGMITSFEYRRTP